MTKLRVLINCACSGITGAAFRSLGHDAWECDLKPSETNFPWHIQGDAIATAYGQRWDLMIAHWPCKFAANSGSKWLYRDGQKANGPDPDRWAQMGHSAAGFMTLWNAPINRIAMENPVVMIGHLSRLFGFPAPAQVIQPWMHGHMEQKATCLWLKGLPRLRQTRNVYAEMMRLPKRERQRVHYMSQSDDRPADRARTYSGIASAFAAQWGVAIQEIAA